MIINKLIKILEVIEENGTKAPTKPKHQPIEIKKQAIKQAEPQIKQINIYSNKDYKEQQQQEIEKRFDEYCENYNTGDKWINVEHQKYVYNRLHEKDLENTNIERLLEITMEDVKEQSNVKQSIENRAGLLMALWGVLFTILLEEDKKVIKVLTDNISYIGKEPVILNSVWGVVSIIVIIGLIIFGVLSLAFLYRSINTKIYMNFNFEDKERNYKTAVDDKYLSIVSMLDEYTNVWRFNDYILTQKSKTFKNSVIFIAIFTIFIIFACIINQFS